MNIRLTIVSVLAVFTALWAMPEAVRGQVQGGDLFATVNLSGTLTNGASPIYRYTPDGSSSIFASALETPRGLAFDGAGNLYVATNHNVDVSVDPPVPQGSVLKFSSDGLMSTFATGFPAEFFVSGLATDSGGDLFVTAGPLATDNNPNPPSTIYKITPDGALSSFAPLPGGVSGTGLACDSAGNVYVANSDAPTATANGEILKFTPAGAPYDPTPTGTPGVFIGPTDFPYGGAQGPSGLAFDASGNLFVSTEGNDSTGEIRKFASDGTEITPRFATGLTKTPRGIAFDGAGNLFVAELGIPGTATTGDILEFTPGGTESVFSSQGFGFRGNRGPEWLAFTTRAVRPPSSAVTLTFPGATTPLTTTVTSVDQNQVPLPPSNFELLTGSNLAFDITTTTAPTPPIIIAFTVPASLYVPTLKALHYENGNWVDSTIDSTDPNYPSNPAPYTIYASVNSLSPFLIAKKIGCQISTSVTSNFNGTPIKSGNYIWFNGVLKPSGLGSTPVTIRLTQQTIASANFTFSVPDATVTFDPTATSATTTFSNGKWVTRAPSSGLAGNTFFAALGYQVPSLPGGIKNVTWSATMNTDTPGVSVQWKWAAAVYTSFSSDYNAVGVKPVDDNKGSQYPNSDHAGTPENFKTKVTGGATGGGGSNYTGGYSGTATVGSCP